MQPIRIAHPHGIGPRIHIGVHIAGQPDGIGLDVAAGGGVIVAILVVVEVGEGDLLAGVGELGRGCGERGRSAAGVVAGDGAAQVVGVQPVQCGRAACAVGGGDRERGPAAHSVVTAKGYGVAYLGKEPDILAEQLSGRGGIFAEQTTVAVLHEATSGAVAGQGDSLVHTVVAHREIGFAGADIAGQAGIAVIAGGDIGGAGAILAREVAARVMAEAARARRRRHASEAVGAGRAGVCALRGGGGIGHRRAPLHPQPVAAHIVDVVLAPSRAGRCVDAREAIDPVILEAQAARRVDQIGDRRDIIVGIIAVSDRPDVGRIVRCPPAAVRAAAETRRVARCRGVLRQGEAVMSWQLILCPRNWWCPRNW